ncbi:hypothetical protein [Nostocoides sp. F2B08]|uniref:hypothetical protein n=1 Tax=Nostocoides sp. F2B08 TaxID=2653936 RepID=UPI00186AFC86|nr:hypothetical protein [Tetrasphaera sp. F2B08]
MARRVTRVKGGAHSNRESGVIPGWVLGVAFVLAVVAAAWVLFEPALLRWFADLSSR